MEWIEVKPFLQQIWQQKISQWVYLDSCDSTNQQLLNMAKNQSIDQMVIVSDEQTSGRGRNAKPWQSMRDHSLLFSVGKQIKYGEKYEAIKFLSLIVGIAICEALNDFGIKAKVKWPNDVMLDNAKLAGILIESQFRSDKELQLVIGIGINLMKSSQLEEKALQKISSIFNVELLSSNEVKVLRAEILAKCLNHLLDYVHRLEEMDASILHQKWHSFDFFKNDEIIYLRENESQEYQPMIYKGINSDGHLHVLDGLDNDQHYHSASVQIRKDW